MKPVNSLIAIAFLILGGAAQAKPTPAFSGNIVVTNSFGNEGTFDSTSVSLPAFNYVTSETGFFQNLNLAADNSSAGEPDLFPTNSEIAMHAGVITLADVTPAAPLNLVSFSGQYQVNLQSFTYVGFNPANGQTAYAGTGDLVDTAGVIQSVPVSIDLEIGGLDNGHANDALTLDIVPEPATWALLAMGLGVVAFALFAARGQAYRI